MLVETVTISPASGSRIARVRATRSATAIMSSAASTRSHTTMNSSLAKRPATSESRMQPSSRRATSTSSSSPAPWPSESLTCLKSSMSTYSTPAPVPTRRDRTSASSSAWVTSDRLGRPVSASCRARWLSSASARLRSVMSVSIATT